MSVERLREAAKVLRASGAKVVTDEPLAAWLDAEAEHLQLLALKSAAVNFLIATSSETTESRAWRVNLAYSTAPEALAVVDAILGPES